MPRRRRRRRERLAAAHCHAQGPLSSQLTLSDTVALPSCSSRRCMCASSACMPARRHSFAPMDASPAAAAGEVVKIGDRLRHARRKQAGGHSREVWRRRGHASRRRARLTRPRVPAGARRRVECQGPLAGHRLRRRCDQNLEGVGQWHGAMRLGPLPVPAHALRRDQASEHRTLRGHKAKVKQVSWSPVKEHLLASVSSADKSLRIWDADSASHSPAASPVRGHCADPRNGSPEWRAEAPVPGSRALPQAAPLAPR